MAQSRVSFTAMSDDALKEIMRRLPERYEMELNRPDMVRLVCSLFLLWNTMDDSDLSDWVWSFVSSLAETVNVEMV